MNSRALLAGLSLLGFGAAPGKPDPLAAEVVAATGADIAHFVADPEKQKSLVEHLAGVLKASGAKLARATHSSPEQVQKFLLAQVHQNLSDKAALKGPSGEAFTLTADELQREVLDYEAFKLETFVSSGVFPKRYFGYVDGKWDTAAYEKKLRDTVHASVALANSYLTDHKSAIRVTDAEVTVTFLAEGGAILLREAQAQLEDIHPVQGIGLDDIETGFRLYPELLKTLDGALSVRLDQIVVTKDKQAYLTRNFTFIEAVAATTLMWVWEKERCESKLKNEKRTGLEQMKLDEQFVLASLVYNSGIAFSDERVRQIKAFLTGPYLVELSETHKKKRGELPVVPLESGWVLMMKTNQYPAQPTSWSAVYHILQRFGAYQALVQFGSVFDEKGMFRAG
jgi:hypothetical protein